MASLRHNDAGASADQMLPTSTGVSSVLWPRLRRCQELMRVRIRLEARVKNNHRRQVSRIHRTATLSMRLRTISPRQAVAHSLSSRLQMCTCVADRCATIASLIAILSCGIRPKKKSPLFYVRLLGRARSVSSLCLLSLLECHAQCP